MSTTTASIFIGYAHPNDGGIQASHLIQFTENSRPALFLYNLEEAQEPLVMIPTVNETIDDIYLMIVSYVLNGIQMNRGTQHESLYDIFSEEERFSLYERAKAYLAEHRIKVVFNLLEGSHLLNQIDRIKSYPNDFEITTPSFKKEYNHWGQQVITKEF
jgi:hypothetical protein